MNPYKVNKIEGGYGVFRNDTLLWSFTNKGSDFANKCFAEGKAEKLELADLNIAISEKRGYFILEGA